MLELEGLEIGGIILLIEFLIFFVKFDEFVILYSKVIDFLVVVFKVKFLLFNKLDKIGRFL